MESQHRRIRFGPFELDVVTGTLSRDGRRVPLQRKPTQLLLLLVENNLSLLSRSQIRASLWMDDEPENWNRSLNSAIRKLRRALEDDPESPRYILTVPRLGYRFVGEANSSPPAPPDASDGTAAEMVARRRTRFGLSVIIGLSVLLFLWGSHRATESREAGDRAESAVAVLAFANLSNDRAQDFLAEGMSLEIIDQLSRVKGLRVAGRTSSFYFKDHPATVKEIGRTLGVSHVLEGSVRRHGANIRVSVALADSISGLPIWSRSFDTELENIFDIQNEISLAVVNAIGPRILESGGVVQKPAVTDLGVYDLYLLARGRIDERTLGGLEAARGYLQRAISLDEEYTPTRVAYAETLALLSKTPTTYGDIPLGEAYARARPHLDRVLKRDPSDKRAHAVLGFFYKLLGKNELAETELKYALSIDPNFPLARLWLALLYEETNDQERCLLHFEKAYQMEPLWPVTSIHYAHQLLKRGRFEDASAVLRQADRYHPRNPTIVRAEAYALALQGKLAESIRRYDAAVDLDPDNPVTLSQRASHQITLHLFDRAGRHLTPQLEPYFLWERGKPASAVAAATRLYGPHPDRPWDVVQFAMWEGFAGNEAGVIELLFPLSPLNKEVEKAQGILFADNGEPAALLALALKNQGRIPEARQLASALGRHAKYLEGLGFVSSDVSIMKAYAAMLEGERDQTLQNLNQAWERGYRDPSLDRNPLFEFLHGDPRWKTLVARHTAALSAERAALEDER